MPALLLPYLDRVGFIPEVDRAVIAAAWQVRSLKEGETLLTAGAVCHELYFVQEGVLRIQVQQASGKEVTHFFMAENRFCTILHSFTHQIPAAESIQAACVTQVLAISRTNLEALYHQLPYLRNLIMESIQQGLLDKIRLRNSYLGQDSAARYHQFLRCQPEVARRVSLSDVASYLGITQQSLSRIRRASN
ncbi:Crp/Fnr family transcriptional regulator [Hymenobacter volaticus]|uniref:Cyclic nucleotide-binding domain-containing protein n=1 Tax=Hymenobacter volaticus TaxID=2932254 RepID=A0ABY4GGE5_9BACT|nr:cyclic nucleotide-binding domain-containing protein [Hymenobacter volaticus]UOQ69911.1 cyclic nucleotide-binding domain-containing protein [Hymenobacter volaticus]